MFTSECDAVPYVKRLIEREEKIGMHRSLLNLLPETKSLMSVKPFVSYKTLYSDFIVREVYPGFNDGEPLNLVSLSPSSSNRDLCEPKPEKRPRRELIPSEEVLRSVKEGLTSLISQVDLDRLLAGLQQGERKVLLSNTTADKANRTIIHQVVKATLGSTHVSTTQGGIIAILKATNEERREENRRSRPLKTRPFLHFTLYKENIDSAHALRTMAKYLHLSTRQFQYCGTKDKRAVTVQRMAIRDIEPDKLSSVNKLSFGPRSVVKVGSFKEENTGLKLGEAYGNYFQITLRVHPCSPKISDEHLAIVKATLEKKGVINYFGPQRFGTTEVLTSDLGLMLLRGQYKKATEAIFESRASIDPQIHEVVTLVRSQDYKGALEKLPHYCLQERDILKHLSNHPNDYMGMLQVIPRTLGMLYFHAAQSLIWNFMVSQRLSDETRACPEVGDMVLASVYRAKMGAEADCEHAGEHSRGEANTDGSDSSDEKLPAVQLLSEKDDLSRFDLSDVLLPIPGPDVELRYPESHGCTKEDYRLHMEALGVEAAFLDHTTSNPLVKIFHYYGTYRAISVRPQRLNLSRTVVSNWLQRVISTDWEQLKVNLLHNKGTEAADIKSASVDQKLENSPYLDEAALDSQTEYQVLMANFLLPSGSYATAVLREFCVATSEGYHEETTQASNISV
ncbi:unnamed protein product [Phytomonas sp. Hart1]|nr:unnamed protein product [Phytomonas sp. Hart1]|eukprot:CCW69992.1 unnamed protein product [Phytomonas sp. isolate Hart1]